MVLKATVITARELRLVKQGTLLLRKMTRPVSILRILLDMYKQSSFFQWLIPWRMVLSHCCSTWLVSVCTALVSSLGSTTFSRGPQVCSWVTHPGNALTVLLCRYMGNHSACDWNTQTSTGYIPYVATYIICEVCYAVFLYRGRDSLPSLLCFNGALEMVSTLLGHIGYQNHLGSGKNITSIFAVSGMCMNCMKWTWGWKHGLLWSHHFTEFDVVKCVLTCFSQTLHEGGHLLVVSNSLWYSL